MLALKDALLWPKVVLTAVAHNLPHGPWLGAAWWRKMLLSLKDWALLSPQGNALLDAFYPYLCKGANENPFGTREHNASFLRGLQESAGFGNKGPRTALRRWFSWLAGAEALDRVWHARLLVILHLGVRSGLYKSFEDAPFFGGMETKNCRRNLRTPRKRKTSKTRHTQQPSWKPQQAAANRRKSWKNT